MADATGRPSTILLKRNRGHNLYEEGRAAATVKPGMLCDQNATGGIIPHGTAGGVGLKLIATEEAKRLVGGVITDSYVSGDLVSYRTIQSGDETLALFLNGASQTVTQASFLISDGAGNLKLTTGTPAQTFAKPLETYDNTGGSAPYLLKVRWL
jgi:hypothetical protein